jgi:Papain family cysteine protease
VTWISQLPAIDNCWWISCKDIPILYDARSDATIAFKMISLFPFSWVFVCVRVSVHVCACVPVYERERESWCIVHAFCIDLVFYPLLQEGSCRFNPAAVGATCKGYISPSRNEKSLKQAVAAVGPIAVLIDAHHSSFKFYKSGVYNEPKCTRCWSLDMERTKDRITGLLKTGLSAFFLKYSNWRVLCEGAITRVV